MSFDELKKSYILVHNVIFKTTSRALINLYMEKSYRLNWGKINYVCIYIYSAKLNCVRWPLNVPYNPNHSMDSVILKVIFPLLTTFSVFHLFRSWTDFSWTLFHHRHWRGRQSLHHENIISSGICVAWTFLAVASRYQKEMEKKYGID